ncbi:MAG: hypothetical protein N2C12_01530, partial [Planctomycetales bacterium]
SSAGKMKSADSLAPASDMANAPLQETADNKVKAGLSASRSYEQLEAPAEGAISVNEFKNQVPSPVASKSPAEHRRSLTSKKVDRLKKQDSAVDNESAFGDASRDLSGASGDAGAGPFTGKVAENKHNGEKRKERAQQVAVFTFDVASKGLAGKWDDDVSSESVRRPDIIDTTDKFGSGTTAEVGKYLDGLVGTGARRYDVRNTSTGTVEYAYELTGTDAQIEQSLARLATNRRFKQIDPDSQQKGAAKRRAFKLAEGSAAKNQESDRLRGRKTEEGIGDTKLPTERNTAPLNSLESPLSPADGTSPSLPRRQDQEAKDISEQEREAARETSRNSKPDDSSSQPDRVESDGRDSNRWDKVGLDTEVGREADSAAEEQPVRSIILIFRLVPTEAAAPESSERDSSD